MADVVWYIKAFIVVEAILGLIYVLTLIFKYANKVIKLIRNKVFGHGKNKNSKDGQKVEVKEYTMSKAEKIALGLKDQVEDRKKRREREVQKRVCVCAY